MNSLICEYAMQLENEEVVVKFLYSDMLDIRKESFGLFVVDTNTCYLNANLALHLKMRMGSAQPSQYKEIVDFCERIEKSNSLEPNIRIFTNGNNSL